MNERQRAILRDLRSMSSSKAADWLLARYPPGERDVGEAFVLIPHLSWTRADQDRLARGYLKAPRHANPRPYEAFAKLMALRRLVGILGDNVPETDADRQLFRYHVTHVLRRAARTDADREAVESFLATI